MRRKAPQYIEPPADLRAFDPGGLTGEAMWAAFSAWRDRRVAYGNIHGWPGGMLVLLQQNMVVRRKLHAVDQT